MSDYTDGVVFGCESAASLAQIIVDQADEQGLSIVPLSLLHSLIRQLNDLKQEARRAARIGVPVRLQ